MTNWWKKLKGRVKLAEPLAKHTTFKIGGRAKFFIQPKDIADLKFLLAAAKRYKIPILVIGAGSNVLVSDKGIGAIVIKLSSPGFRGISLPRPSVQGRGLRQNYLEAGAGCLLSQLLQVAKGRSLSGIEFLAGIPGTIGGALTMNAGSWGRSIGDFVEKVSVMDYNGRIKHLNRKEIRFGYRKSNLDKFIILSAALKLFKGNKETIQENIKSYLKARRNNQDTAFANAGCIFKNARRQSAGKMIDLCGLKGRRSGNACISEKHANFILNIGSATAADVLRLMGLMKKRVRQKFNLTLEPEIKIWA